MPSARLETWYSKSVQVVWGIVFGIALELAMIRPLNAYDYGQFTIMILDVRVCIGVAWGCIPYSAMEFSDGRSMPKWTPPVLVGLLALNIDLALDAVAIRRKYRSAAHSPRDGGVSSRLVLTE